MQSRAIDALVYAPLNKQAMKLAGLPHEDELHFSRSCSGTRGRSPRSTSASRLWTARVTSHVPLRDVAGLLTVEKIRQVGASCIGHCEVRHCFFRGSLWRG